MTWKTICPCMSYGKYCWGKQLILKTAFSMQIFQLFIIHNFKNWYCPFLAIFKTVKHSSFIFDFNWLVPIHLLGSIDESPYFMINCRCIINKPRCSISWGFFISSWFGIRLTVALLIYRKKWNRCDITVYIITVQNEFYQQLKLTLNMKIKWIISKLSTNSITFSNGLFLKQHFCTFLNTLWKFWTFWW